MHEGQPHTSTAARQPQTAAQHPLQYTHTHLQKHGMHSHTSHGEYSVAARLQVDETVTKLQHTTHPVWIMRHRNGGDYYGFPQFGDQPGLKVGRMHHLREQTDPDAVRREVNDADIAVLREAVADCFPCADGAVLKSSTCLFTNTPDHHFLLDTHPAAPNVRRAALPPLL